MKRKDFSNKIPARGNMSPNPGRSCVLVVAGTSDARRIIEELGRIGLAVCATVTTGFGEELLKDMKNVRVIREKLESEGLAHLIAETDAGCLLDASHPFAARASANAIEACALAGIPYMRYERADAMQDAQNVIRAENFEDAAEIVRKKEGNIFLTIGSRHLEEFARRMPDFKKRVFARVLPDSGSIRDCEALGLSAGNIFAAKGPFSEEMNLETFRHFNISVVVAKDSGEEGGTPQKIRAASRLGIPVVLVKRPGVEYPARVSTVEGAVLFAQSIMNGR